LANNTVSFDIPDPMKRKLDQLSRTTKRDPSVLAREALADYLLRQDEQAAAIDEAVRAADDGQFVSNEAMSEWLESWGRANEKPVPGIDVVKARR
jgi:RHH-type transcriptional regulator, rel operon repressor / antitoxin RelB